MHFNILRANGLWSNTAKWKTIGSSTPSITCIKNCTTDRKEDQEYIPKFETVFSFPFVRYIATLNKMKKYHIVAASTAIPSCTLLEMFGVLPENSYLAAAYIGVTGGILLSLASIPFNNTIGFLYISEDNKLIKVSVVDFWGRRKDRVIPVDSWTPLLDMKPKTMDAIYLSPQLADGTKYKLFIKFGKVMNSSKMGQVLE